MLVSEIFDKVEKTKGRQQKISTLQQLQNQAVFAILQINYNPTYVMNLPEGEPPFKKEEDRPEGYQQTNILNELRRFYIWLDPNQNISNLKRESLFIEMLEGLHLSEAKILVAAKDGLLTKLYKSITEKLVRDSFPELLPPKGKIWK